MEALRFDLRFKVALDLPLDHPGFHPTTLVRFRARLLLHGKERLVFERSLSLASELGLLEPSPEQIVDSTPMLGAAAVQDTVSLVRSGVRSCWMRSSRRTGKPPTGSSPTCASTTPARARSRRPTGRTKLPAR